MNQEQIGKWIALLRKEKKDDTGTACRTSGRQQPERLQMGERPLYAGFFSSMGYCR